MNSQTTYDYIVVGQGLAGSCVALQLLSQGKRIMVVDRQHDHSATNVAAGLFNPITGRNMTKTWLADILFPYLHDFYRGAESLTNEKFFNSLELYRPFVSVEEQNEWMGKSAEVALAAYVEHVHISPIETSLVRNEFGGLMLKQCGYLNTGIFMQAVRRYIKDNAALFDEDFKYDDLNVDEESIFYKGQTARRIIFCQGVNSLENTLFSWLPIRPLKGETLTIKPAKAFSKIYNRGVYVVPDIWKVGATYEFKDKTPSITDKGRQELIGKLDELVAFPYGILHQSWGMRPTTPDRRPVLGPHPQHKSVIIFNGLGTKGVSLAPYFSKVLVDWLEKGVPINKEVDIERYKHYNYGGIMPR